LVDAKVLEEELNSHEMFQGMTSNVWNTADPNKIDVDSENITFGAFFKVEGADHPGIINHVTDIFLSYGLSINR